MPLEVVDSPFREFVKTAVAYVRSLNPSRDHTVTVVMPELVVEHWWEELLHNQDALRLKGSLLREPWVVVMSIPLHVAAAKTPRRRRHRSGLSTAAGPRKRRGLRAPVDGLRAPSFPARPEEYPSPLAGASMSTEYV